MCVCVCVHVCMSPAIPYLAPSSAPYSSVIQFTDQPLDYLAQFEHWKFDCDPAHKPKRKTQGQLVGAGALMIALISS